MRSCTDFAFCVITGLLLCALKVPAEMVRGIPGVDYPNYHTIPSQTSFKCSEQKYFPGFYADVETDCQVFHFCFDNRYESFLCPTGTTFNQPILACDMWYNSNCTLAPLFYVMNAGPGIKSAEKRIPMLLKLRDQAEDGATTMASVSSVFQQISDLNKENVHETPQILDEGTATVTIDDLESDSNDVGDENETDSKISGAIKFENSISDIQEDQSAGDLKTDHQYLINALYSRNEKLESQDELSDESKVPELIYDPVTDGYYTQNDYTSDSEWPSESQPNSQYQGFYDFRNFNNQMMQDDGESVQFPDGYVNAYADEGNEYSEEQNENPPENMVFDKNYMRNGEYYDEENEFAKRLQISQIPKYSRRKPTYIVVDQPEMSQTRQGLNLYPGLGSTESPYAESISIDSVVDESSTEFMEFAANEDAFKAERNEPNEYFEKDYSEDSNLNSRPHSNSESDSDSDVVENGWETSEAETDKFQESEDRSFNTESNLSEVNKSYPEENEQNSVNAEERESEDITIYDDSYPQVYDGVEQNVASDLPNEQDTLIVIPDETDFPTTPKVGEIGSSNDNYEYEPEDPNQNWQYVYSGTSETSQNINPGDARYMYNEIEKEQGASEMEYSETYDPSQYAEQRNYAYPGMYDDINYSRYQPPVYADQQTQAYEPGSYYQYVPQDREYFSEQEPLEKSYQMPEGNLVSEENPEFSEYSPMTSALSRSPNTPGNMYFYQSPDEQSYGYNYAYPQVQDGYRNDYPYSAQYGYPQNSDGNLYSNEGNERQSLFENEYVTESSDTGLPLDQEYEGLQQTWAQTDFESENSEAKGEEEAETKVSEFETAGYTSSYDELGSERQNSEFNVQDSELLDNFQDARQNEETYYVIEDEANSDLDSDESSNSVRETTEGTETESNKTSDVDHGARTYLDSSSVVYENMKKDAFDSFEPSKANIAGVYSDSESMLNIPDEGKRDDAMSEFGIKIDSESLDKNSNPTDSWQSQEFVSNRGNAKPVTASSTLERLAGLKPNIPAVSDFIAPTETRFLNSMQYPNTMSFSPYGYGTNMGQQFSMMDSQNRAPFSETENRIPSEAASSGMSRLSKLSTFQDKVRSMKGGKFGMFKKYMNSMKNQ